MSEFWDDELRIIRVAFWTLVSFILIMTCWTYFIILPEVKREAFLIGQYQVAKDEQKHGENKYIHYTNAQIDSILETR